MKKNSLQLVFIISLFFNFFCIQNLSAQDCEYKEYYNLIYTAKKSYFKKEYKNAKEYFQIAFSKTDFPLGQDLSFALHTASKVKDYTWAQSLAKKLARGGVPLRYFTQFKKEKWYKGFELQFHRDQQYYNENFNKELQKQLILLLQKDVNDNNRYHKWRAQEIELSLDELIEGRKEILDEFKELVKVFGFPNERLLGYNYVRRKNIIEPYNVELLMVHIYQKGVFFLKDEISNIICEGGLAPNYEEILKNIKGFANGNGVEQEMKARYLKYRGQE